MASLRDQLTAIYRESGELTPGGVVAAATPVDHPLHDRFEWDDSVAGHEYRKVQASELIRSVKIVYRETPAGEPVRVRAFSSVRDDKQQAYRPTEEVLSDEFSRRLLLNECRREIESLKRRYGHLEEFAALLAAASA